MPTDMMIEDQITLWVPLASRFHIVPSIQKYCLFSVVVTALGLFVWFCRSDQSCLDAETPCLQKFCCCLGYKRRGDDGHLHLVNDEELGSSTSLKSTKSTVVTLEDDVDAVAVEDNAANLEAVLDPEGDENQEGNAENDEGEQNNEEAAAVDGDEPPPAEEDNGEAPSEEAEAPVEEEASEENAEPAEE